MTRHEHWIGGRAAAPASGAYLPTIQPATRAPGDEIAAGTAEDVNVAVAAASAAWRDWAARPAAARSAVLHAIADAMAANAAEFKELEGACTGKLSWQLDAEIDMSVQYFRYYAGVLRSLGGRTIEQGADTHTYTRIEPYGVVAIITPWNLPLNQAARAGAPAIAIGNAVVLKPSEFTSPSSLLLARLATEAGLPDGVLNVVTGTGPEVGAPLADHPDVRRIAFTGSVATGRFLAGRAAERLVPATLELGGKSPLVVFADADLDKAAAAAAFTVAFNAGQVCSATTRLIAQESIHDDLVARINALVDKLQPGVDFGPMITQAQFDKVLASGVASAYEDGPGAAGLYIRPTVHARVPLDSYLWREEVFGPVLSTTTFTDEAEALRLANDTDYGLVGAVWSGDVARGLRLAERIEAGQVSVNGGALTIETPFGGYKNSGYGREKGLEALHDYAHVKTVSLAL